MRNQKSMLFAAAVALALSLPGNAAEKPMNVLFLVSDDLNSWLLEDPERYGGKVITPNLDKIAGGGVRFDRAYAAAPVCNPSRTAFLSGIAPWKSGVYHNAQNMDLSAPLKKAISLGTSFKKAGYSTFAYGKISHGWDQKGGWDEKVGHKRDPRPPGAPLAGLSRGESDWGPTHLPEEKLDSVRLANLAVDKLKESHDKPFLLACGFFNPHMPWYPPQKYFDMYPLDQIVLPEIYEDDLKDLPPTGQEVAMGHRSLVEAIRKAGPEKHKEAVQAYLATTTYVDVHMGRILDALDQSPYRDNTIVVFLSDHGFHLGEKFTWQKSTIWEEATHCVLMVRVPGLTPKGAVSQRFVSLLDLYPTLMELCGITPPGYLDGKSLVPLLKDPNAPWESTAITGLCDKVNPKEGYMSIRTELGRFIHYKEGEEEYYDTANDPHEWHNQINNPEYASTIKKLRGALPPAANAVPTSLGKRNRDDEE